MTHTTCRAIYDLRTFMDESSFAYEFVPDQIPLPGQTNVDPKHWLCFGLGSTLEDQKSGGSSFRPSRAMPVLFCSHPRGESHNTYADQEMDLHSSKIVTEDIMQRQYHEDVNRTSYAVEAPLWVPWESAFASGRSELVPRASVHVPNGERIGRIEGLRIHRLAFSTPKDMPKQYIEISKAYTYLSRKGTIRSQKAMAVLTLVNNVVQKHMQAVRVQLFQDWKELFLPEKREAAEKLRKEAEANVQAQFMIVEQAHTSLTIAHEKVRENLAEWKLHLPCYSYYPQKPRTGCSSHHFYNDVDVPYNFMLPDAAFSLAQAEKSSTSIVNAFTKSKTVTTLIEIFQKESVLLIEARAKLHEQYQKTRHAQENIYNMLTKVLYISDTGATDTIRFSHRTALMFRIQWMIKTLALEEFSLRGRDIPDELILRKADPCQYVTSANKGIIHLEGPPGHRVVCQIREVRRQGYFGVSRKVTDVRLSTKSKTAASYHHYVAPLIETFSVPLLEMVIVLDGVDPSNRFMGSFTQEDLVTKDYATPETSDLMQKVIAQQYDYSFLGKDGFRRKYWSAYLMAPCLIEDPYYEIDKESLVMEQTLLLKSATQGRAADQIRTAVMERNMRLLVGYSYDEIKRTKFRSSWFVGYLTLTPFLDEEKKKEEERKSKKRKLAAIEQ